MVFGLTLSDFATTLRFQAIGLADSQNTNDRVAFAIQADRLADDVAVAAEALLPEPVSHDEDAVFADLAFLRQKIPTQKEGRARSSSSSGSARRSKKSGGSAVKCTYL